MSLPVAGRVVRRSDRSGTGDRQGWAWIAVADEGPGVPEDRDRIFDRFIQSRNGSGAPAAAEGSGLGLAIARRAAEGHSGRLLHTQHGPRGSTFTVWLPDRTLDRANDREDAPPNDDPLAG